MVAVRSGTTRFRSLQVIVSYEHPLRYTTRYRRRVRSQPLCQIHVGAYHLCSKQPRYLPQRPDYGPPLLHIAQPTSHSKVTDSASLDPQLDESESGSEFDGRNPQYSSDEELSVHQRPQPKHFSRTTSEMGVFPPKRTCFFNPAFSVPYSAEPLLQIDIFDSNSMLIGRGTLDLTIATFTTPCFIGDILIRGVRNRIAGAVRIYLEMSCQPLEQPIVQCYTPGTVPLLPAPAKAGEVPNVVKTSLPTSREALFGRKPSLIFQSGRSHVTDTQDSVIHDTWSMRRLQQLPHQTSMHSYSDLQKTTYKPEKASSCSVSAPSADGVPPKSKEVNFGPGLAAPNQIVPFNKHPCKRCDRKIAPRQSVSPSAISISPCENHWNGHFITHNNHLRPTKSCSLSTSVKSKVSSSTSHDFYQPFTSVFQAPTECLSSVALSLHRIQIFGVPNATRYNLFCLTRVNGIEQSSGLQPLITNGEFRATAEYEKTFLFKYSSNQTIRFLIAAQEGISKQQHCDSCPSQDASLHKEQPDLILGTVNLNLPKLLTISMKCRNSAIAQRKLSVLSSGASENFLPKSFFFRRLPFKSSSNPKISGTLVISLQFFQHDLWTSRDSMLSTLTEAWHSEVVPISQPTYNLTTSCPSMTTIKQYESKQESKYQESQKQATEQHTQDAHELDIHRHPSFLSAQLKDFLQHTGSVETRSKISSIAS